MVTRVGHYELSRAEFNATNGELIKVENMTSIDAFAMGYVAVDDTRAIFAAQMRLPNGALNDVELYEISATAVNTSEVRHVVNQSGILIHCRNESYAPKNCTDTSTFYPQLSSTGDLLFAFRAWNGYGDGLGNQALAIQNKQGGVNIPKCNPKLQS